MSKEIIPVKVDGRTLKDEPSIIDGKPWVDEYVQDEVAATSDAEVRGPKKMVLDEKAIDKVKQQIIEERQRQNRIAGEAAAEFGTQEERVNPLSRKDINIHSEALSYGLSYELTGFPQNANNASEVASRLSDMQRYHPAWKDLKVSSYPVDVEGQPQQSAVVFWSEANKMSPAQLAEASQGVIAAAGDSALLANLPD